MRPEELSVLDKIIGSSESVRSMAHVLHNQVKDIRLFREDSELSHRVPEELSTLDERMGQFEEALMGHARMLLRLRSVGEMTAKIDEL